MAIFVKFWGTRGSIPTPGYRTHRYGGNTSCVEIRVDGTLFICDGGTGLRDLGQSLIRRGDGTLTAHLLFSHAHWDHIQGFPFFAPAYDPTNTLYVYGAEPGDQRIYQLLSGQMGSHYFPVDFKDLAATILPRDLNGGATEIEGATVRAILTAHNGLCYAFSIEKDGHKVIYSTDHELDRVITNPEQSAQYPNLLRRLPEDLVACCHGADLLICDGQYTDEEYPSRINWGHPRATTSVDLALQAGVKQLAIFHHDPMQTDRDVDAKITTCRERAAAHDVDLLIFGAREGVELKYG